MVRKGIKKKKGGKCKQDKIKKQCRNGKKWEVAKEGWGNGIWRIFNAIYILLKTLYFRNEIYHFYRKIKFHVN